MMKRFAGMMGRWHKMAFNKWKTGGRLKLEWRYVICPLAFLIVLLIR